MQRERKERKKEKGQKGRQKKGAEKTRKKGGREGGREKEPEGKTTVVNSKIVENVMHAYAYFKEGKRQNTSTRKEKEAAGRKESVKVKRPS